MHRAKYYVYYAYHYSYITSAHITVPYLIQYYSCIIFTHVTIPNIISYSKIIVCIIYTFSFISNMLY